MKKIIGAVALLTAFSATQVSAATCSVETYVLKAHARCSLSSSVKYYLYKGQEVIKVDQATCGGRRFAKVHRLHDKVTAWARWSPEYLTCNK